MQLLGNCESIIERTIQCKFKEILNHNQEYIKNPLSFDQMEFALLNPHKYSKA